MGFFFSICLFVLWKFSRCNIKEMPVFIKFLCNQLFLKSYPNVNTAVVCSQLSVKAFFVIFSIGADNAFEEGQLL